MNETKRAEYVRPLPTTSPCASPTTLDDDSTTPRRRAIREILLGTLTGLLSVIVAILALRISPSDLTSRWVTGSDDSILHYTLFTSSTEAFSFADNPDLGFPHGLNLFFSTQVDVSSAFAMSFLGLFIHSGITLLNVFTVLTFLGTGAAGYAFFRALRVRSWIAVLFGILFSIAPYHFIRVGYGHAFISNYWAIPLIGILVLMVAGPATDPLVAWASRGSTRRRVIARRSIPIVLLTLAVATTGAYYFVFGVIVIGGAWLFTAVQTLVRRDRIRTLFWPTIATGSLAVFVLIELFLLGRGYGQRYAPYFDSRLIAESELYAGKIMTLLLPWDGSKIPILRGITAKYEANSGAIQTTEAPGAPLIASVGIILLFGSLMILALSGGVSLKQTWFGRLVSDARARVLATSLAWTFLFYIVSGLGIGLALEIGPQIRAWSRLSIVLILLGLGFMALLLNSVPARAGARVLTTAAIIAVALVDQVAGVSTQIPLNPSRDLPLKHFVDQVDKALPNGCGVVQLPLKSFPDSGTIGALQDYDEALPFLYTKPGDIRWSYGSIRGTKGWNVWENVKTPAQFARAFASTKACAVEVDTDGYTTDKGAWKKFVEAATGTDQPAVKSQDGTLLLFTPPDSPSSK